MIVCLETSTTSGLEAVILMSAGMVEGGESLACLSGRSAKIFTEGSSLGENLEGIQDSSKLNHASMYSGLDLELFDCTGPAVLFQYSVWF